MKFKPYQLALLCDAAIVGRRKWLWLAGNILLLLLSIPFGLLWPIFSLVLLINAVLMIYLVHQHHAFGKTYHCKPRPVDALCETVQVDADLIGHGVRVRAAAQPIDVAEGISMRLGSGTLPLGTAMVLTLDEVSAADRAAILSAVNGLHLTPSRLLIHNPVLSRSREKDVSVVTVRDGMNKRHYYIGAPEALAQRCASIWEGSTRAMTERDQLRIADTAHYITQGNCRVLAWATALEQEEPIFLGMCGLGEEVHPAALDDVATLRGMGLTLMLSGKTHSDLDLESLHALLQLPVHHAKADIRMYCGTEDEAAGLPPKPLAVIRKPGDSLVEPITQLRRRFHIIEATLRRFAKMLLLPLLIAALICPGPIPAGITLMMIAAAIYVGVDLTAPRLHWPTLILICLLSLLTRFLTAGQPAEVSLMTGGIITVTAAWCAMKRLCGPSFRFSWKLWNPTFWLTFAGFVLDALMIWHGISAGAAWQLPILFAGLISGIITMLMLYESRFFR